MNAQMRNVHFSGGSSNLVVTCARCGTSFDAAPPGLSGTVTISTSASGRLKVAREAAHLIAELTELAREELLEELRRVGSGSRSVEEARAAATSGTVRQFWDLVPRTRGDIYAFLALVVSIIALFQSGSDGPTERQIEHIVQSVVKEMGPEATPTPAPGPARLDKLSPSPPAPKPTPMEKRSRDPE